MAFGASALIGKQVSWTNSDGSTSSGAVSAATFTSSGPTLTVGSQQVPLTSVVSVANPSTSA
jgi:flagellar basal-body rod modification protein FlgD